MHRLTTRAALAGALLVSALFIACSNPPSAPERRSLPHRAHLTHLGPTANWVYECLPKNHGLCTFDASASVGAVSYAWGFGPGEFGTGVTTEHQFTSAGYHNVTLIVTDAAGAVDYRERSVFVRAVKGRS